MSCSFRRMPRSGACVLAFVPALASLAEVVRLDSYTTAPSGGEIVAFDKSSHLLYVTAGAAGTAGVEIVNAANPAHLVQTGLIDLGSVGGLNSYSVSSVAADPLGRGFGVATFIPEKSGSNPGKVVFFDPVARTVLNTIDVGYHPDMIRFSSDGSKLFVANEGEPVTETGPVHFDQPGSISVVNLAGVSAAAQVGTVGAAQVATYDFSSANLAAGVNLDSLRVHPSNTAPAARPNDIEPEYITEANNRLYVTLQENNGVAEFDLAQGKWTRIDPLGTIQQRIDASANDGGIHIDDNVVGLPMPDGVATVTAAGKTYYLTANEGDSRPADRVGAGHPNGATDEARFQQLGTGGRPALDAATDALLDAAYGGDAQANSALGRLRISLIDGNTDADPAIEVPTMFGTRSFSIYDAATGQRVFDSGSDFETITAATVPASYNSNGASDSFDARSQNKGPEPEGITTGMVGDSLVAFIGLERVGGVMAYDITDPTDPFFLFYLNTGEVGPEGLDFVPASSSPTGHPLLYVGFEVSGQVAVYQIVIPEAGTSLGAAAVVLLGGFHWLLRRARSKGASNG